MADPSALRDLLDRADHVFSLAGDLGRAFYEEGQSQATSYDPSKWQRHAPAFDEFCRALTDLLDAMDNPPNFFAPVAKQLLEAAQVTKAIKDTLEKEGRFTAYVDCFGRQEHIDFCQF